MSKVKKVEFTIEYPQTTGKRNRSQSPPPPLHKLRRTDGKKDMWDYDLYVYKVYPELGEQTSETFFDDLYNLGLLYKQSMRDPMDASDELNIDIIFASRDKNTYKKGEIAAILNFINTGKAYKAFTDVLKDEMDVISSDIVRDKKDIDAFIDMYSDFLEKDDVVADLCAYISQLSCKSK